MWAFQPQMGTAAGASQDYSTQFNWMSAGPRMVNTIRHIRDEQNQILEAQALLTETPRVLANPPIWPAAALPQFSPPPSILEIPKNHNLEHALTNAGLQIAGGEMPSLYAKGKTDALIGSQWKVPHRLRTKRNYWPIKESPFRKTAFVRQRTHKAVPRADLPLFSASPFQVCVSPDSHFGNNDTPFSECIPTFTGLVRSDGTFQLAGGSAEPLTGRALIAIQGISTVPRSGGIGSKQFVNEFVPTVYYNPYSGPPNTFPDQFISNFNVVSNSVDGYD